MESVAVMSRMNNRSMEAAIYLILSLIAIIQGKYQDVDRYLEEPSLLDIANQAPVYQASRLAYKSVVLHLQGDRGGGWQAGVQDGGGG